MAPSGPVFVAGEKTLLGAALKRALERSGIQCVGEGEVDLSDPGAVEDFFSWVRPSRVFFAAGRSGGILANTSHPADLMLDNLRKQTNVIEAAWRFGVEKLLYLGSSCCYPRECPQPIREEYLLTGPLEPTNEAYAVAKIAGIKLCEAFRNQRRAPFICAIPSNLFGPGDDFSEGDSHVVAALLRRMHSARCEGAPSVTVWGTGKPVRDFLFVDDAAEACLFLMDNYDGAGPINVGSGRGVSIAEVALAAKEVTGYEGDLLFDSSKPDGMPEKVLDTSKIRSLGWRPRVDFKEGLRRTYDWFRSRREVLER